MAQQNSDDRNLKVPKLTRKNNLGRNEIRESVSCVKNIHNLDFHQSFNITESFIY